MKDAERALCFLRGWTSSSHVREELMTITTIVQQPADRRTGDGSKMERFWEPYFRRSVTVPFLLVSVAFFVSAFGGSATLQTYAVFIFEKMNAPVEKYTAAVYLGVAELVGTATCVVAIHFTGKRSLNFVSIGGTGLCFFCSATYVYLVRYDLLDSDAYTWLPMTLLIGSAFLSHTGIRILAWILAGEVFPAQVTTSSAER